MRELCLSRRERCMRPPRGLWLPRQKFTSLGWGLFVQDHRGGSESPQHIRGYLRALSAAMAQINVTNWVLFPFHRHFQAQFPPLSLRFAGRGVKDMPGRLGIFLLLNTPNVLYA